jgi:hypothetical protein
MFPEHLSLSNIQRGIKTGKYLQGSFMASREIYLEANVSVHDQDRMRNIILSAILYKKQGKCLF